MSASPALPLPAAAVRRLSGLLTHLGVSRDAFDDTVGLLSPLLRVHSLQARLVERRAETSSATSLYLQTGAAFPALRPGQYVIIGVTIRGVRHRRAYSPRAVPGKPGHIAITVQRQPGGLVSQHLNEHAQVGDVFDIETPGGDFVLPSPLPAELLLIAGGSGITPGMAMLRHLHETAPQTRVTLVYFARSERDRIFAGKLADLAKRWNLLRYVPLDSSAHTPSGQEAGRDAATSVARVLDTALLDEVAPGWSQLPTWCCGPAPLMDAARQLWKDAGASDRLRLEAFAPPQASGDPNARHAVALRRDRLTANFEAAGNLTLLAAGEQAGLQIKHGCRQGICHECTCRLHRGSVQDLSTGQRIDGEGQPIRLCVSAALSDVDLESLN
mgnify:FL=1